MCDQCKNCKNYTPKTGKYPNGSIVRILYGGNNHALRGFNNAEIVVVLDNNNSVGKQYRVGKLLNGVLKEYGRGFADDDQLELIALPNLM